jgi:hypothetical protein
MELPAIVGLIYVAIGVAIFAHPRLTISTGVARSTCSAAISAM